nr:immunoglobulin heavy chain junction region [Mus musculus]
CARDEVWERNFDYW